MQNGIILAGGTGSRLQPLTQVVNKHLLGVHGKFIIDYSLNTLKKMGCENITVVLGGNHFSQVVGYLEDGARYNLNINYVYQGKPQGIAQAIAICKKQVSNSDKFAVILGDNIYEDNILWNESAGAQIVLSDHRELNRFGVASFGPDNQIQKIEEKPKILDAKLTNLAITGCYLFTSQYFDYFNKIKPSDRGEYEITDIIRQYHKDNNLSWVKIKGLWSDAGTHESINYINNYLYQKEINA